MVDFVENVGRWMREIDETKEGSKNQDSNQQLVGFYFNKNRF